MECGYKIGRLKPVIYLVEDLVYTMDDYKVIIESGDIYKINCDLVTFNETESYSGRFKFTTTVTAIINKVFKDDSIRGHHYKVIVETEDGIQYLSSVEFDALYTSESTINNQEIIYQLTFTTQSNIPARILKFPIKSGILLNSDYCEYVNPGIEKLWVGGTLIDFLTCEYNKTFDGNYFNTTLVFTFPIEDSNWYYELINFPDNYWDIMFITFNKNLIKEYRLFPQYTIQTSENLGTPSIVTMTLSGREWAGIEDLALEGDFYAYIPTSGFICDGFTKYVKLIQLKNSGNGWVETGVVRKGALLEEESEDCGYFDDGIYEWEQVDIDEDYACVGYNKHYILRLKVSRDNGITWEYTGATQIGDLYQANSPDCGFAGEDWREVPGEYICEPESDLITWVDVDGYICDSVGLGLYKQYKKQQKYVNGVPAVPAEFRRGELIGIGYFDDLEECGTTPITCNRFLIQYEVSDPDGLKGKGTTFNVNMADAPIEFPNKMYVDWGDGTGKQEFDVSKFYGGRATHIYSKDINVAVVTVTGCDHATEIDLNDTLIKEEDVSYPTALYISVLNIGDVDGGVFNGNWTVGGGMILGWTYSYLKYFGNDLLGKYSEYMRSKTDPNSRIFIPYLNIRELEGRDFDVNLLPGAYTGINWVLYPLQVTQLNFNPLFGYKYDCPPNWLQIYMPKIEQLGCGGGYFVYEGNTMTEYYLTNYPNNMFDGLPLTKLVVGYGNNLNIKNLPKLTSLTINWSDRYDTIVYPDDYITLEDDFLTNLPSLETLQFTFKDTPLKKIPENMFKGCTSIRNIDNLFENTKISSIPENFLEDFTLTTNSLSAEYTFRNCTNLTSIPNNFISNIISTNSVDNLTGMFSGCTNLRGSTPTTLDGRKWWEVIPEAKGIRCFEGCTNLDDYNEIPNGWK